MFVRIVRKFIYLVEIIFFWQDEILFRKQLDVLKPEDYQQSLDVNIGKLLWLIFFNGRKVVIVNESKTKWIYVMKTVSN